jgi:hypothetical protein
MGDFNFSYRVSTITFACVMVAACGSLGTNKKEDMTLLQGQPINTSLQGQPLTAVIGKLGLPTDESSAAGSAVHIWSYSTMIDHTERKCQIRAIMSGNVVGSFNYEGTKLMCMKYIEMLQ